MARAVALVAAVCGLFAGCSEKVETPPAPPAQSIEAAAPAVAQPATSAEKTHVGIGPIHAGMTAAELEALGLPFHTKTESSFGADYIVDLIEIGGDVEVSTWIVEGVSADVSTVSPGLLTAKGAHVGDTVARLRELYPAGEIAHGYESEVGLYYTFITGEGEYFRFDTEALGEDCVVRDKGCPADMSAIGSIRLDVY